MSEEPTIILELTPREAAVIHEMALMYNWERGEYRKEVRDIYHALDKIRFSAPFNQHSTNTITAFGEPEAGLWWVEDGKEDWLRERFAGD